MTDIWLAAFRLLVNLTVGVGAILTARKLLLVDRRMLIQGVAMMLLGAAAYNIVSAFIFMATTLTGARVLFGIQVGWFYATANAFEAIPLVVLLLILNGIIKSDNIDENIVRLTLALNYIREIRQSAVWAALPEEDRKNVELAEDQVGNLTAKMQGWHQLYKERDALLEMRGNDDSND